MLASLTIMDTHPPKVILLWSVCLASETAYQDYTSIQCHAHVPHTINVNGRALGI